MLHPKLTLDVPKKQNFTIPIILVGNKSDLEDNREVNEGEACQWLRQRQSKLNELTTVTHIEISAKNDVNVQELFERLFTLSSLPREMSPNLHRKVTENAYAVSTQCEAFRKVQDRLSLKKRLSMKLNKTLSTGNEDDASDTSSVESYCSYEYKACDEHHVTITKSKSSESVDAMATARVNDRRPSVDTEVILAISKSRTYPVHNNSKKNGKIKSIGNHIKCLKKQVNKLKL